MKNLAFDSDFIFIQMIHETSSMQIYDFIAISNDEVTKRKKAR